MTTSATTGAAFKIVNSKGTTVLGPAPIGKNLGTWGKFKVFALDFDSVSDAQPSAVIYEHGIICDWC